MRKIVKDLENSKDAKLLLDRIYNETLLNSVIIEISSFIYCVMSKNHEFAILAVLCVFLS